MKLERILIGVDFSEASLAAARWVTQHLASEAEVVLVHAIELPEFPSFAPDVFLPWDKEWATAEIDRVRPALGELATSLDGGRILPAIRVGQPAREIAMLAEEWSADLVVVGEHGRGGGLGGLWTRLGSTAERVVRSSSAPVLLARGMPPGKPRRILAPIDHSEVAASVLGWARLLRETTGAELVAMHTLGFELHGRLSLVSTETKVRELERRALDETRRWLESRLGEAGIEPATARVEAGFGQPAIEILAAARRLACDLIVIGGRGAGAVARALLGSVVSTVLRGAGCPVLVVVDRE